MTTWRADADVFIADPAAPAWVRRWRGPFTIQVFQARAATITTDDEYGKEVVVRTEDGRELRSGAGADGDCTVTGEYVRVLDAAGREQGYWTSEEWREDPEVVMGAIVGCLLGLGDQARAVTKRRGEAMNDDPTIGARYATNVSGVRRTGTVCSPETERR